MGQRFVQSDPRLSSRSRKDCTKLAPRLVGRSLGPRGRSVAQQKRRSALTIGRLLSSRLLPDVAIASLAFVVRQIDVRLTIPLQCLTNLICLLPKPSGGEMRAPSCFSFCCTFCAAVAMPIRTDSWDAARARFWDFCEQRLQRFAVRVIRKKLLQEVGVVWCESTASVY